MKSIDERLKEMKYLQELGVVCRDGDFVPSVHYPPITKYLPMTDNAVYETYTQPSDGCLDIYVHFPFCAQHCVFCHYPGKLGPQVEEKARYLGYLKREILLYKQRFGIDKIRARSILIGGGTPTYMAPEMLEDFLKFFNEHIDLAKCKQFNYDVDPNTLVGSEGLERLRIMKEQHVTRLTIGIQSLDNKVLKIMNRAHNASLAIESVENCKRFGFDVNIEFIYGHPGETLQNWEETIRQAITLPTDEIQIYRLKVLAYGDYQGEILNRREETMTFEQTMTMKQHAINILNDAGYYENMRRVYTRDKKNISHYAYNQCCNLYDQVGFGITAFSSYRDRFALNTQYFKEYYSLIDSLRLPTTRGYIRGPEQQLRWSIILPLKNMDVKKKQFERINGVTLDSVFTEKFRLLKEYGLVEENDRILKLTDLGGFVADEIAEQFNSNDFKPFPQDSYTDGVLNPYKCNTKEDAFGSSAHVFNINGHGVNQLIDDLSARRDVSLNADNIQELLSVSGDAQQALFTAARQVRQARFGSFLNINGVINIPEGETANGEAILNGARQIINRGIRTIVLQSDQSADDKMLEDIISAMKDMFTGNEIRGNIMLALGEKSFDAYKRFAQLGATGYILDFSTSNEGIYRDVFNASSQHRLDCLRYIRDARLSLGTGIAIGLPKQTLYDVAADIEYCISLKPEYVNVNLFEARSTRFDTSPDLLESITASEHMSLEGGEQPQTRENINTLLNAISILRLALPGAFIPTLAALDHMHKNGQAAGLLVGANMIGVNFTPVNFTLTGDSTLSTGTLASRLNHAQAAAQKAGMHILIFKRGAMLTGVK
ncbi:MAG: radical SAM protein [Clostridiales bacterium]|jgi:oxygen-independent coproporphyrinogen-3 oxidase|nr:radical SAM protein [Clostridiales bacterium]